MTIYGPALARSHPALSRKALRHSALGLTGYVKTATGVRSRRVLESGAGAENHETSIGAGPGQNHVTTYFVDRQAPPDAVGHAL